MLELLFVAPEEKSRLSLRCHGAFLPHFYFAITMSDSEEEAGGFGGSDSEEEGKTLVLTIACCPHLLWTSLATVGVWLGAFLLFLLLPPLSFSLSSW